MTALMTRPTDAPSRRSNRRRVALWGAVAGVLAAAAIATVLFVLTRPAPLQVVPHVPPLQAAQQACDAGRFDAQGALILDVTASSDDPAAWCVLVDHLGLPARWQPTLRKALSEAVPDLGNATNTISWGRLYAQISPAGPGRASVRIVQL